MKIAHATDLHWFAPPTLKQLVSKRLLGTANLYLRGRRGEFSPEVQAACVEAMAALDPDVIVITGDLTAQGTATEFDLAHEALRPLLDAFPTLIMPGNHDTYTGGAYRSRRIRERFADWMGLDEAGIGWLRHPGLTVVALDPNRPALLANGEIPAAQLDALPDALAAVPPDDFLLLALHYPVLDRRGALYDGNDHGLLNAAALVEALRSSPRRPELIIHGHKHHGFRVDLDLGDATVPICNPGAGGYAYVPEKDRAACFNVYEVEDGALVGVERHRYGPDGFAPEPGGAYATGR